MHVAGGRDAGRGWRGRDAWRGGDALALSTLGLASPTFTAVQGIGSRSKCAALPWTPAPNVSSARPMVRTTEPIPYHRPAGPGGRLAQIRLARCTEDSDIAPPTTGLTFVNHPQRGPNNRQTYRDPTLRSMEPSSP